MCQSYFQKYTMDKNITMKNLISRSKTILQLLLFHIQQTLRL